MSPGEITKRLKLRARGLIDRDRYSAAQRVSASRAAALFLSKVGKDPKARIGEFLDCRFFFGPSSRQAMVDFYEQHYPADGSAVIDYADRVLRDGLELLGQYTNTDEKGIDWHIDPQSGNSPWPNVPMDEQMATSTDEDVKYVWELNRHQFLPLLGRAYWHSNDPRYASSAITMLNSWIDQNPVGRGVNWSSHLEVAMRSISWLWSLPLLLNAEEADALFLEKWLTSLAEHYDHLVHNLSVYTDPTNHLIGEATALWMLSVCLPDLPEADTVAAQTENLLIEELDRQVFADGVNTEQASSYHRFVLDFYTQIVVLCRRLNRPLPQEFTKRVEAMFEFAVALAGKEGVAPMIGDCDDARGIPLLELVGWDFTDVVSTGAVLFERTDWKAQTKSCVPATLWLLSTDAHRTFDQLPIGNVRIENKIFPNGGYGFLPIANTNLDADLIFDFGPLGLWPNAAHGHADALSILVRVNGHSILTDPGTGTYFGATQIRDQLRKTSSHNTVTVDGFDQADIFDTFKWVNPFEVRDVESCIDADHAYVAAAHDGFRRLRSPVTHHRSVVTVPGYAWIVIDRLTALDRHSVTQHFHLDPRIKVQQQSDTRFRAVHEDEQCGVDLLFLPSGQQADQCLVDEHGTWSRSYGHWQTTNKIERTVEAHLPLSLVTVVRPIQVADAVDEVTEFDRIDLGSDDTWLWSAKSDTGSVIILVNPRRAIVQLGKFSSDSKFAAIRLDSKEDVVTAIVIGNGVTKHADFVLSGDNQSPASRYQRGLPGQ